MTMTPQRDPDPPSAPAGVTHEETPSTAPSRTKRRRDSIASSSVGNARHRRSRQQPPVSCHFCRTRKLRCNREQPCSNCLSRGITCQIPNAQVNQSPPSVYESPSAPPSTKQEHHSPAPGTTAASQDHDLHHRLERLERLVVAQSERWNQLLALNPQLRHEHLPSPEESSISTPRPPPPDPARGCCPGPTSVYSHVSWLENYQQGQERIRPKPHIRFMIRTAPILQLPDMFRHFQLPPVMFPEDVPGAAFSFWMPPIHEAQVLLTKYIDDISWYHHIYHIPTLKRVFLDVYANLENPEKLQPGQVVLVFSIIAAAMFYWTNNDCVVTGLFSTVEAANSQASSWLRVTMYMIEVCNRMTFFSLELMQGILIVLLIAGNIETLSLRYRYLLNMGLTIGHEMRLHLTDHPDQNGGRVDRIEAEVRRRTWWYFVTTDWLLAARSIGAYEGVYHTSPRQIAVRWPAHLDDEDLTTEAAPERPLTQATTMSFMRQRILLGEIARDIADRILSVSTNPEPSKYSDVLAIDADLEKLAMSLPSFFRLRGASTTTRDSMGDYPQFIKTQKYFVNLSISTLRCKVNLPFLGPGFANQAYLQSRNACLDAARKTIQAEIELEAESLQPFLELRLRMTGLLQGLFLATSALFMDICLRNAPVSEEIRKGETGHALRILESAARHSRLAGCLIRSMMQVLRKHSIESNQNNSTAGDQRGEATTMSTAVPGPPPVGDMYRNRLPEPVARYPQTVSLGPNIIDMAANMDQQVNGQMGEGMDLTAFFGELAETFGSDSAETIDWLKVMSELDSTFA